MTANKEPYHVEFSVSAEKQFAKLDKTAKEYVYKYLNERIEGKADPREYGGPLHGALMGSWKYTIGSYRAICNINDADHIVKVIKVAARGKAYKK